MPFIVNLGTGYETLRSSKVTAMGATIYVGRAATVLNGFFFKVHTTVE